MPLRTAGGYPSYPFEFRRAGQEYHLPAGEAAIAAVSHIAQQGVTGREDMVVDGVLGNRDVFNTAGSARRFGQVNGKALPQYIMSAFFDQVDI